MADAGTAPSDEALWAAIKGGQGTVTNAGQAQPTSVTGADIIAKARSYIGKFTDGPDVPRLAQAIGQAFPDLATYCAQAGPTTSWCGIFVAYVLMQFGIRPPYMAGNDLKSFMWVDSWLTWGEPVAIGQQRDGDVQIFLGNPHHVNFAPGVGGNQSDAVTEHAYRTPDAIRRAPAAAQPTPPVNPGTPGGVGTFTGSGKGSWYSQYSGKYLWVDRGDEPNSNALGVPDDAQGCSFDDRSTLGCWFLVRYPNGFTSPEQQTDIGPAPSTGRLIDISAAAAERAGYSPKTFPTDETIYWQRIDPPAQVAGLTPQQQAVKYRDWRKQIVRPPPVKPPPTDPNAIEAKIDAAMAKVDAAVASIAARVSALEKKMPETQTPPAVPPQLPQFDPAKIDQLMQQVASLTAQLAKVTSSVVNKQPLDLSGLINWISTSLIHGGIAGGGLLGILNANGALGTITSSPTAGSLWAVMLTALASGIAAKFTAPKQGA